MVSFPFCKINLGLNIIRKRNDGYHDIETCFFPVPLTDILEIIPSDETVFTFSGEPIPGDVNDNLCLQAYGLLKKHFAISPVKIHLHKIIPTGAGLGGGSSDAAHVLRGVNSIFKLDLDHDTLLAYAKQLGSDCSFFLQDKPLLGYSRGEVLKPSAVDLSGKYLVLLNPGLHVSTAEAYAGVTPGATPYPLADVFSKPVSQWKFLLQNDFEHSVFKRFPLIGNLKTELYNSGALYASMSGSGSSIFGIFDNKPDFTEAPYNPYLIWSGFL